MRADLVNVVSSRITYATSKHRKRTSKWLSIALIQPGMLLRRLIDIRSAMVLVGLEHWRAASYKAAARYTTKQILSDTTPIHSLFSQISFNASSSSTGKYQQGIETQSGAFI